MDFTTEVDAQLLEQFSALGTSDKDELVYQFKAIVGSDVSFESCRFFLELGRWNLQRAVGAFFDFSFENSPVAASPSLVNASYLPPPLTHHLITAENFSSNTKNIYDASICLNANAEPSSNSCISFCVRNVGSNDWPPGCYLKSEANLDIATLATRYSDKSTILWLPIGPSSQLAMCPLRASDFTNMFVTLVPPSLEVFAPSSPCIIGALSLCLPSGEKFGETLYCSASLDLISSIIYYQCGAVESKDVLHHNSDLEMEDDRGFLES